MAPHKRGESTNGPEGPGEVGGLASQKKKVPPSAPPRKSERLRQNGKHKALPFTGQAKGAMGAKGRGGRASQITTEKEHISSRTKSKREKSMIGNRHH